MAAQKEYSFLFKLGALLTGGFSSAFQKAQKELEGLQKAQAELNKQSADVKAINTLQKEIEKTEQDLSHYASQMELVRNALNATGGSSLDLTLKLSDMAKKAGQSNQKLQEKKQKLEELKRALEAAGYDTSDLIKLEAALTAEMRKNEEEMSRLKAQMDKHSVSASDYLEIIGGMGITGAVKDLTEAYKECVIVSANFEESMSNVKALASPTSVEMQQLTKSALDLAASTKFTAQEVGDAMGYMSMAGWDANEMLGGMSGVINLAAASGEKLERVSDIVTDNLTAFGMKASQTAEMADILAAAATNSNTNVEIMGETFKNSASIAGALGYSLKDVAVAVGVMANNGIKGSIAGTSLRNIFNGLLGDVKLTSKAFGEYELTTIKSDGTLMSFSETLDMLRQKFALMTEAEKVTNAKQIAGMRGYNGLLALINATNDEYASLANSIENSTGAAQKMANIKLDNLNGQLTLMKSAWDAVKISLGSLYKDELKSAAEGFTELLHLTTDFIESNPALVKGVIAAVGAFGAATAALSAYCAAIKVAGIVTKLFGASLLTYSIPLATIAGGVGLFVAGMELFTDKEKEARMQLSYSSREQLREIESLEAEYDKLVVREGASSASAKELHARIVQLKNAYDDNVMTLDEYNTRQKDVASSYEDMDNTQKQANLRMEERATTVSRLVDRLKGLTDENGYLVGSELELKEILSDLNGELPSLNLSYDAQEKKISKTAKTVDVLTRSQVALAKAEQDRLALTERERNYQNLVDAANEAANELNARRRELQNLEDKGVYSVEAEAAVKSAEKNYQAARERLADHEDAMSKLRKSIDDFEKASGPKGDSADEVVKAQIGELQALAEAYQTTYSAAYSSISGQKSMWDDTAKVVPDKISELNKNIEGQIDYWKRYNDNLAYLDQNSNLDGLEGLTDLIKSMESSAGSEKTVNFVAGITEALKSGDTKSVTDLVENLKALEDQQKASADEYSQYVNDFDDASKELAIKASTAVDQLKLTEEAKESARETLEAYIEEISNPDYGARIQSAFGAFKSAVRSSISVAESPNRSYGGAGKSRGFASGTSSAPTGWRMVGEDGPELMYFRGGERVLNHGDTVRTLTSDNGVSSNNISVAFNIGGNADGNTVQQLQSYAEDFASRVMEIINDANSDAARRAYA